MKNLLSNDLKVITSEIYEYDSKERNSVFEIGKRFKHVKKNNLTNGQYSKWIEELGYTLRTEQRYRKVYERFGNMKEAENFRVSYLFEMLSIKKSVDIKAFLSNKHKINGELKTVEQMKKREIRDLVKAINETIAPKKATPASQQVKGSFKLEEELSKTLSLFRPDDEELLKLILDNFEIKLEYVLDLNDKQRKELLYCCKDESYDAELLALINLVETGWTHEQIRKEFLSLKQKVAG